MNNIDKNFHINFSPFYAIVAVMLLMCFASELKADTSAKIGGTFVNLDESIVFTGSIDNKWETELWQGTFEADYAYKAEDGDQTINKFNTNGKLIKSLNDKHYVIGVTSYDYDEFRTNNDRIVMGAGHGYKILRTEKQKASIENSIAYLISNGNNEPILRSSLWYTYKLSTGLAFTNKMLWESGDDDYLRNETSFDYSLTENVTVGIKNVYTKDPIEYSIFNITLGVKF
jgi:putative salt-induced outer membrane protein YdiY